MYEDGKGVPQDNKQAAHWYHKAAEQGYARAQTNLAVLYENGKGVPQDEKQAAHWYRKAAEQGYGRAQRNLRWMCPKIGCKS
ncbi:tetratricopeptide repeat protein [Vibrio lentus]|nr:tetratricopeptide repeat protein [Vibrio lentus]